MRILDVSVLPDRIVGAFGSTGFSLGHVGDGVHAVVITLEAGGRIGRHPAVRSQMLIPVSGRAFVAGGDGVPPIDIGPGKVVVWDEGESHETTTVAGLTAVILEGDEIAAVH